MLVSERVLRKVISSLLEGSTTASLRSRFPFIQEDTMKLLQNFVWRVASDIARADGTEKPDAERTRKAAHVMIGEMGEFLDGLISRLAPAKSQKKPERRAVKPARPLQLDLDEEAYSEWPIPQKNR